MEDVTAGQFLARPQALEIPAVQVDGNDVWAVREAARAAVARARAGEGPQFVEALTYRFVGHSRSDPGAYRKPGELDPLKIAREVLGERAGVSADRLDEVDAEVDRELDAMVQRGLAAPYPPADAPVREFKG